MEFWKKNKWKIIIPALIVLVLAAAFVLGDRTPAGEKPGAETMQTQQPETTRLSTQMRISSMHLRSVCHLQAVSVMV